MVWGKGVIVTAYNDMVEKGVCAGVYRDSCVLICVYQRGIASPSPALAELTLLTGLSASKNPSLDQR